MEVAQQFGINPILLTAQIVNFLIVLYILKRILYKPVQQMLKTRQEMIQKGLQQAEEARLLMEKTEEREREILRKAQQEAKKLLDETRAQRDALMAETETATKKQAETILNEARAQIAFETSEAEKRLSSHITQLAVQFLQKSVSELFSEDDQDLILKNALKKMKEKSN